jgi:hypothetical protein
MQYEITSPKYFKRYIWYLGSEFGVSIDYWYPSSTSLTLDDKHLDPDEDGE